MTKRKMLFIFFIALIACLPVSNATEVVEEEPTGIFNALFLGRENTRTFSYAPWGNRSEENATIQNIRIGSGGFYSKFAYYGKSPLKLVWQPVENQDSAEPFEISYSFKPSPQRKEEILLVKRLEEGAFQVYPMDFSEKKIPMGTFLFKSFSNETVYISIEDKKFILEAGSSHLYRTDKNSVNSSVVIVGYLMRNGKYKKVFKQMIRNLDVQRGVIMLRTKGSTIKSMNLLEHASQNEKIIGLGTQPFTPMPLPPESDESSRQRLEAFPREN